MRPNKVTYTLIKKAVEKGIRDMQENVERGMRNLVDLGERFAHGRFQKSFFDAAQKELIDTSSPYYRIAESIIRNTDAEVLTTIGMNIGYNSWTFGAQYIRGLEDAGGFNIPWTMLIDLDHRYGEPDFTMLSDIIAQGQELGIFTFLFLMDESPATLHTLLDMFREEGDCAFLLFVRPQMLTDDVIDRMFEARNILPVMDIDYDNDGVAKQVADRLSRSRLLYAGFTRCEDLQQCAPVALAHAEELQLYFLLFMRVQRRHPRKPADTEYGMEQVREKLEVPVCPIDLYYDIAYVDEVISSEACIAVMAADGSVYVNNVEAATQNIEENVYTSPLRDIFQKTLPKKKRQD